VIFPFADKNLVFITTAAAIIHLTFFVTRSINLLIRLTTSLTVGIKIRFSFFKNYDKYRRAKTKKARLSPRFKTIDYTS